MPRAQGNFPEEVMFFGAEIGVLRVWRAIEPIRNQLGAAPKDDERKRIRERLRFLIKPESQGQGNERDPIEIGVDRSPLLEAKLGFGRGLPFQEAGMRDCASNNSTHDSVEGNESLMRKKGDVQEDADMRSQEIQERLPGDIPFLLESCT